MRSIANNLAFTKKRVCRKFEKSLTQRREGAKSELTIFAPSRLCVRKFHAAIFLLLRVFKITLQWCSLRTLKTNGVELGEMTSGLWGSPSAIYRALTESFFATVHGLGSKNPTSLNFPSVNHSRFILGQHRNNWSMLPLRTLSIPRIERQ